MFWRCLFRLWRCCPCSRRRPARRTEAWEDCGQTADQDRKIAGCTQVLGRGAAESETSRVNAYVNRGYAYSTSDNDRAIKDYDEAIRLDPKAERAYNARGVAYFKKGDYDRAIKDLDEAIRLYPPYALAYTGRGKATTARAITIAPSGITTRRSASIRNSRTPTAIAAMPTPTRATTTAPSGITTRRSASIRICGSLFQSRPRLLRQARSRPRHQGLQRRRSASTRKMPATICIVGAPTSSKTITTAPSRSTTRQSASIRNMRSPMRFAGEPMKRRETPPGPKRITTRRRGCGGERGKRRRPRRMPTNIAVAELLLRKGRLRQRHQGFCRGDPSRSKKCDGP